MRTRLSLRSSIATLACGAFLAAAVSARDGTLALIETLRSRDCAHALASAPRLRPHAGLDAAAIQIMKGRDLRDALKDTDARAMRSAVIRVSGSIDDASLLRTLRKGHCGTITDAGFTAIGIAQDERAVAIVLATPVVSPASLDATDASREVLQLVNEARAGTRRCGKRSFAAAPPLSLNPMLNAAATAQASDMAANGYLSHRGSDDSQPADRVARVGYAWQAVGENVAAGQYTAQDVVDGWLSSPDHCVNIMDPEFTEMGVAYVTNATQEIGIYWAQVFGRPRLVLDPGEMRVQ